MKYHYEFIPTREVGHQYRVADNDDEIITDFKTEEEAIAFVRGQNSVWLKNLPDSWRF